MSTNAKEAILAAVAKAPRRMATVASLCVILRARLGSKPPASITTSRAKPTRGRDRRNGIGRTAKAWLEEVESTKAIRPKACASIPTRSGCRSKTEIAFASKLPRRRIRRSSGTSKEGGPELRRYQCSLASRAFDRSRLSCVRGERRACACSFRCDCRSSASCTKPFGHLALRLDDQELSRSRASPA